MSVEEKLKTAYATAKSYPELAAKLIDSGILSYTVEVAAGLMLYRLADGETIFHDSDIEPKVIAARFNTEQVIKAIRDNQQGKSTFPEFMDAIATAGVRFYEATLNGDQKRVTYMGSGGFYQEEIPL
ncbi:DUF1398 family protein [Mucilaginibacter aquaedulcis]|jgi:uncharacterized protein YbcV (DUF1398 family)|uniref:DUF1398 family protein n=1 Tax=Mucilaginibacter aquaedulcis TaxID=1187081 RepID=UPI0025B31FC8|nr:DUF1398 family protein [Mucilaginibacter aquaedulcis]MDN3550402.1 DUF1398 family protein [Mucilaginibacter aquaedulcis]